MIKTCKCGKEFLTEADPHVIIPAKDYEVNCGCYFEKALQNRGKRSLRTILEERKDWNQND